VRIAVVTTWLPTKRSPSVGSFIARDIAALGAEHDLRVLHLAADAGEEILELPGASQTRSFPFDLRTPGGWIRSRRIVRAAMRGVDVVHTMAAPALLAIGPGGASVPWVHTEHWSGVVRAAHAPAVDPKRLLMRTLMRRPDIVVAVSDYLGSAVESFRRQRVPVVGNIVDVPPLAGQRAPFAGGQIKVLGVGTVAAHKGWSLAVDTIETLRAQGNDASLTWLGDGPELELMRRCASRVPLAAPGHVAPEEVREAMRSADVLILPTLRETFSLVTAEALASGTPVVATGRGGHQGLITAETGVIVARDREALAQGVLQALQFDRQRILARGRELVDNFSEVRFRTAYAEIYERLRR